MFKTLILQAAYSPVLQGIIRCNTIEVPGNSGITNGGVGSGGAYVPWDIGIFYDAIDNLYANMGAGINIAFWIFLLVTGVYFIFKVVGSIGK